MLDFGIGLRLSAQGFEVVGFLGSVGIGHKGWYRWELAGLLLALGHHCQGC